MHIRHIGIKNIRSIRDLSWTIPATKTAGWHVIIGDNGAGKSTFLRSVALVLVGSTEAMSLRQNWDDWVARTTSFGWISLGYESHPQFDRFAAKGRPTQDTTLLSASITLDKHADSSIQPQGSSSNQQPDSSINPKGFSSNQGKEHPDQHIWSGKPGWFSAGYGPFRRFSGGSKDYDRLLSSNPKLAAHLSLFGEDVALTECLRWLQDLQFKKLENNPEGDLLDAVKTFVNQTGFLPHQAYLDRVSSSGVDFIDGNGCKLPVEDLSDGYRSILSLTFELIRQLARVYGTNTIFDPHDPTKITPPGVVLIDEIDAHLHPTWQRKIGLWFREHFPNLQFIVTTHSPLICQAATVGSVWRLPKPGSNENGGMIEGRDLERLLYGNVLDAYGTELFGANINRSEEAQQRLRRLAELNQKELRVELTAAEQQEQSQLRATMGTAPHVIAQS